MPEVIEAPSGTATNGSEASVKEEQISQTPVAGTQAATPQTTAQPEPVKTEVPEDYEWEGDPNTLEKPLQNRAKGVLRYLTKQSQALAEEKKLAEEYRKVQSDPLYQQYLQYKERGTVQQPVQPSALFTVSELEEAQVNPGKLGELMERAVNSRISQAEQQVVGKLEALQSKQTFIDKQQELQDFAELHPDFWDLHQKGLIKPYIREIVDTGQGTLQDAYNKAKEVREQFRKEALMETQGRVNQKKAAFTSAPTPSNEPDIIWANDKNEATKIAFENALLGKKVQVKVKK